MTSIASRSPANPQSPSKPGSPQTVSPPDDHHSLQSTPADLQAKRLSALQLYQEEKAKRIAEAARAAELAAKIDYLAMSHHPSGNHDSAHDKSSSIITTDFFIAEVCSLGLARGGPSASLTWHCLAMADLMTSPPKIVLVADPKAQAESLKPSDRPPPHSSRNEHGSYPEQGQNEAEAIVHVEKIAALSKRVRLAEAAAAAAKKSQEQNELLIADLKAQLDASTSACKDLLETVRDQEDTIESLS